MELEDKPRRPTLNSICVYVIVIFFGLGTWITLNGIWVELPLIVPHLPEGWALPSFLSIIIQVANIGPVGFTVLIHFARDKVNDRVLIYLLVVVGSMAAFFLVFFWKTTSLIGDGFHSTGLFMLVFVLAVVCCSSSVVFLPFMAKFKKHYVTAFFIGQGLSGLLPSLLALGQGVGSLTCENITSLVDNDTVYFTSPVYHKPNFSVQQFMMSMFAMMVLCCFAFILLNHLSICKKEFATNTHMENDKNDKPLNDNEENLIGRSKPEELFEPRTITTTTFVFLLFLNIVVNALANGCLLPVQTYSCLPYGNEVYHLSITLSNIANPIACFMALVLPRVANRTVYGLMAIATVTSAYILYIASASPHPPLLENVLGSVLVVSAWVITIFLLTFIKVCIATVFRNEGKKALRIYGIGTQAGSTLGAIVMYILINVIQMFENAAPCPQQ